jgi:hypothetical protein
MVMQVRDLRRVCVNFWGAKPKHFRSEALITFSKLYNR